MTYLRFALGLAFCVGFGTGLPAQDTTFLSPAFDTLCTPGATLETRLGGVAYAWSTGQTTRRIDVPAAGTYVATITDAAGELTVDERRVTLVSVPDPVFIQVSDPPYCPGDTVEVFADLAGFDSLRWTDLAGGVFPSVPGDERRLRLPFAVGTRLTYVAYYDRCRTQLTALPPLQFTADQLRNDAFGGSLVLEPGAEVCPGDTLTLRVTGVGEDAGVRWGDGEAGGVRTLVVTGPRSFSVTVPSGCADTTLTAAVTLATDCPAPEEPPADDCRAQLPELITPNGDGTNDRFRLFFPMTTCEVIDFSLRVFNRWGQVVYESTDPTGSWDGTVGDTPQENGVYLFHGRVLLRGTEPIELSGQLTLLR